MGEEIAQAITSAPIGEPIDETELDDELAELEQEQLDNKMLKTGTVPVSDEIHRLPAAANGESKFFKHRSCKGVLTETSQGESTRGGGRRRGRAPEAAGRDGDVIVTLLYPCHRFFDIPRHMSCRGPASCCWRGSGCLELYRVFKIPDPFPAGV